MEDLDGDLPELSFLDHNQLLNSAVLAMMAMAKSAGGSEDVVKWLETNGKIAFQAGYNAMRSLSG